MSASLELAGVDELRAALRAAPAAVTRLVTPIIQDAADGLAADLRASYPVHTGALVRGIRVSALRGPTIAMRVRSTAPHAHLYDRGTVKRFTRRHGASRGVMPPAPEGRRFVPKAIKARAAMLQAIARALNAWRLPGTTGRAEVRER